MTKQDYTIIMKYFNEKKMDRTDLEASLNFENLTMVKAIKKDVAKLLGDSGYKKSEVENAIKEFVRFIKSRSGSGDITWDELINKLKDSYLEDSEFGIRVQRFCKEAYWEVYFNHYDVTKYENGVEKFTIDNDYYWETENEKAYDTFEKYGFNTEFNTDVEQDGIIQQIAEKWSEFSCEDKDKVIFAAYTWFGTHYVNKSRVDITNDMVEKITMTNADLVPEVGLRDYTIEFKNGEMIFLRF